MRVTIVANEVGGVGGMEHVLAELVRGLAAAGDAVTVIARAADVPGSSFSFHRVRGPTRPFLVAYPWFLLMATLAVRRHRSGVVQATGAIVLNRVDVLAIHFCHRAYADRTKAARASRATLLYRIHARLAKRLALFGEWVCLRPRRVRHVVAVSPGVASEVRTLYPRLATRVSVISNGVDRATFHPASVTARRAARARFGLNEARRYALFVGGDWARKGLRPAIGALAHADAWELVVAGRGDEALYESVARSAGIGGRVHFLGVVTDTPELYRAADVFILPTAYETFSLVAYEAAASALPLLTTRVSGIEDVLHDGVSGFVVGADDRDIGRRLRQFDAEPGLAARMGAEARRITEAFTWEAMILRHRALYRAVGAEANASRPGAV